MEGKCTLRQGDPALLPEATGDFVLASETEEVQFTYIHNALKSSPISFQSLSLGTTLEPHFINFW